MDAHGEFDYVVVGAGSAGCVVAARLCASGAHSVALLEAGGEDSSFWMRAPLGYGKLYNDARCNWLFEGEPETGLAGVQPVMPRGKVLGGTSTTNGMVYVRGQRQDFDGWRALGNTGWGYDDVLPYFRKAEDNARGADHYHGAGGPIGVADMPRHELVDAFVEVGRQAGYPANADFNAEHQEGFGYNQLTIRGGRRSSSASAYLEGNRSRANLAVITHARATRILFRERDAIGVEFIQHGSVRTVLARRDVIVSAGTFNSPALLQVSGIGPAELLRPLGIPIVLDSPGVGANLQDHFNAALAYRCTKPITISDVLHNPLRKFAMGLRYLLLRDGMMATGANFGGGFIRTEPTLPAPDVTFTLALWSRAAYGRARGPLGLHPFSSFGVAMSLLHPDNRGTVRIRSADSAVPPQIAFQLFLSEADRRTAVKGLRAIRMVMKMPAIAPYVAQEMAPGPDCVTDDELVEFCRRNGRSNNHSTSTCKMGIDSAAVVDSRLRVHGVRRLRVIDASIMPCVVGGNTNAATVMIGEKGAAMLLEDATRRALPVAVGA
ncbi:MAG: GMC family oxidoreductase N-terminal domain-containing protein [Casimicrobiaceae bacterium]